MINFLQTILHDPANGQIGNCFSTCIACLLSIDPDRVPVFCAHDNWREETNRWLQQYGLFYQDFLLAGDARDELVKWWGYHIISGDSPRGTRHSIIGFRGEPYWDVHPSGDMLVAELPDAPYEYGLLVALELPSLAET